MNKTVLFYTGAAVVGVGAVIALVVYGRKLFSTAGTPYANTGAVGAVANVVDLASGRVLSDTGATIGESIYNWFNPPSSSPDIYYSVQFPDGGKHSISARDIDASGYFTPNRAVYTWSDGTRWRIGINSGGIRVAVPADSSVASAMTNAEYSQYIQEHGLF